MNRKVTERNCPKCGEGLLTAVEPVKGKVYQYFCGKCEAIYHAEVFHDFEKGEHWWMGMLCNPDFWNMENKDIHEGLQILDKRERSGVQPYLGCFLIEHIPVGR